MHLLYVARLEFCCSTPVVVLASLETLINVRGAFYVHIQQTLGSLAFFLILGLFNLTPQWNIFITHQRLRWWSRSSFY